MPIYEYVCTACDQRSDILHGINGPSPQFCPSCGREGTMRKLFAPPTIHYRGSGWAKKDRGGSATRATPATPGAGSSDGSGERSPGSESSGTPAASSGSSGEPSASGKD